MLMQVRASFEDQNIDVQLKIWDILLYLTLLQPKIVQVYHHNMTKLVEAVTENPKIGVAVHMLSVVN
jgi:hypothetical protein